jgi:hypothetical protein
MTPALGETVRYLARLASRVGEAIKLRYDQVSAPRTAASA